MSSQVYDDHWKSTVEADVTVVVRLLPREAVVQSGSIRIAHLSASQFVTAPDEKVSPGSVFVSAPCAYQEAQETPA